MYTHLSYIITNQETLESYKNKEKVLVCFEIVGVYFKLVPSQNCVPIYNEFINIHCT